MAAETKVVGVLMHDQRAANHRQRADQLHLRVLDRDVSNAVGADVDIAQITDVALGCIGSAVRLAVRVVVRAGRDTAVAEIAKLRPSRVTSTRTIMPSRLLSPIQHT